MIEYLKQIEEMDYKDLMEFKQAVFAYEVGLHSKEITFKDLKAIEDTMEYYYDCDSISYFIETALVDYFESAREEDDSE